MKIQKYDSVGTIEKLNIKVIERGEIDTPNTQIHDRSLQGLTKNRLILMLLFTAEHKSVENL